MCVSGWPPSAFKAPLSPPTLSMTFSAPRATAENTFFKVGTLSVVAASSFRLFKKLRASGAVKVGPLIITKSWVTSPSDPGNRAPSVPTTLMAMPRGVETLSSSKSPGVVDSRITMGKDMGVLNKPCASTGGRPVSTCNSPRNRPWLLAWTLRRGRPPSARVVSEMPLKASINWTVVSASPSSSFSNPAS